MPSGYQHGSTMEVPHRKTLLRARIFFPTDGDTLSPDDKDVIRRLAFAIRESEQFKHGTLLAPYDLTLEGFADLRASDEYNRALAARRVDAVREELYSHFSFMNDPVRVTPFPVGEVDAGSEDWNDVELALFRRVDVMGLPLEYEVERPPQPRGAHRWLARLVESSVYSLPSAPRVPFFPFGVHKIELDLIQVKPDGSKRTGNFTYTGPATMLGEGMFVLPNHGSGSGELCAFETDEALVFNDFLGLASGFESSLSYGQGGVFTSLSLMGPVVNRRQQAIELGWLRTADGIGAYVSGSGPGVLKYRN